MGQLTSVTSDRGSPAHGRALLLPCLRRCGGSWTGSRRRRRGYRHRHLRAPPTSVGDLSICSRSEWGAEPNCSPRRAPPEPHSAEGDVVGGMALPPPHERRGTRRLRRQCRLETSDDRLVAPRTAPGERSMPFKGRMEGRRLCGRHPLRDTQAPPSPAGATTGGQCGSGGHPPRAEAMRRHVHNRGAHVGGSGP